MKIADWLLGRNSKEGTSPLLHADGATFGRRDNFSGDREPSRQGSFADDEATDFDESTMTLYAPSFQNYASGGMSINNNNNNDNDNDDNNNKEPPIAVNSDLEGILGENYEAVIIKPKVGFFHPSRWFYRWTILILSSCFLFAAYFADVMIGSTAPLLINEAGFTSFQVGMLMSATAFPSVVISPISGVVIDKIGTNKTSLFFNFVNCVGSFLFAFFDNFYGKLVGALVLGIGFEPMGIVQDGIIARWFMWSDGKPVSPSVPLAYGMSFSGTLLGQFLGMIITPMVAETNLTIALYIPAGIMAGNFLCNIVFVILDRHAAPILGLDEVDEEAEEFSLKHILHFPVVFWLLSFISLFSYSQIWILMTFSTDYVHNEFEGYSSSYSAHINSIMYGIPLILSPIIGYFLQKTKYFVSTMTIGAVLLTVGEYMLTFTWINPIASMIVLGLAYCLVPAAIWPMINMTVREDMISTAFGIATLVMAVGGVVGPLALGYMANELGSYKYPFYLLGGMAGLGTLLCFIVCVLGWTKHGTFAWNEADDEEENQTILFDETTEAWAEEDAHSSGGLRERHTTTTLLNNENERRPHHYHTHFLDEPVSNGRTDEDRSK